MKLPCCFSFSRLRKKSQSLSSDDAATNLLQNQILQKECKLDPDLVGLMRSPSAAVKREVDAQFVDVHVQTAAWFASQLSATACEELLQTARTGRFLIRSVAEASDDVASTPLFELFLRTDVGVQMYTISKSSSGSLCFEGRTKTFRSLSALVVHHSIMREHLPIQLVLTRDQSTEEQMHQEEEEEIDFIDIDCDAEFSELVSRLQGHVTF
jgi:SH2 domain